MRKVPVHVACMLTLICVAVLLMRTGTVSLAGQERAMTIEALSSPAGANSAEPQLTSQSGRTILSWIERTAARATVKFAERTASGWSDARVVASAPNLFVNSDDVPSVRALANGTLVAHWLREGGGNPDAYDVRLAWSKDGGLTWSPPTSPHHDGTKTEHGFVSMFQATGGGLGIVWLDGRRTNPEAPEGSAEAGNMGLRATVYGVDRKQQRETLIAPRVCECCSTAAAVTSEGVLVAYRGRSEMEVRDIYVARLTNGRWNPPAAVHDDGWRIEACPINGPALSAHERDAAVAWFTVQNGEGRAFAAFSHDAGQTFGQPVRIDEVSSRGKLGIALLENGSAAVSWVEFAGQHSSLEVRQVHPSGVRSAAVTVAGIGAGQVSGVPRLIRSGNELLLAWTETDQGSPRVRTARAVLGAPANQPFN